MKPLLNGLVIKQTAILCLKIISKWRNLTRNKSYAAINITGLAVGIAVCMVIFIIIQFQTSFDSFHPKKDRAYRVLTEYHHAETGDITYGKDIPFPLPLGLKTAFPQIEQVAPIFASQNDQLIIPDENGATIKMSEPTQEEIAIRAQEIYIKKGRQDGQDMENWLEAEAQLKAEKRAGTKQRTSR